MGKGAFPDTLSFVRTFDLALAQTGRNSSLLGSGWMHNFDMTAWLDSDGFEGMGAQFAGQRRGVDRGSLRAADILNLQTNTAKTDRTAHHRRPGREMADGVN